MISDGEIETLHVPFRKWLDDNKLLYRYSIPGRRTSENASDADFWIVKDGRILQLEFKRPKKGMLSDSQKKRFAEMAKQGCMVHVVKDLCIACDIVSAWLIYTDSYPKPTVLTKIGNAWCRETKPGQFEKVKNA